MELEKFGLNAVTVSFFGTLVFSAVAAWGFACQARAVWRERSGQSLSTPSFLYSAFVRVPIVVYGLTIGSLALIVNGALPLLPLLPLVAGLRKFRGFRRRDRALIVFLTAAVIATVALPCRGPIFMVWVFGSVAFAALQPLEMWRNRNAGVVDIRMLLVGLTSNTFWLIYAFAIDDWVLEVINPAFLAVNTASLILWCVYRSPRRSS